MSAQKLLLSPPPALLEDERWVLAQRVASSRHFTKATQLHDFLLFVTLRLLEGREAEINELNIGCSVLGRDPAFSPAEDNIVRVQARHLRKKVEDYFSNEGRDEQLILTIPKGGYVPHFEQRQAEPLDSVVHVDPPGGHLAVSHPAGNGHLAAAKLPAEPLADATVGPAETSHWRHRSLWVGMGVVIGMLVAGLGWAIWRQSPPTRSPLLDQVFREHQETNIVVADSCLSVIQDILNTDVTLDEYMEPNFRERMLAKAHDPPLRLAVEKLFRRQYTSLGDLNIASRLIRESQHYPGVARVRYARHMSLREFKTSNFVLIGSHRSIPWSGLFDGKVNFHPVWEADSGQFYFENRNPAAGEKPAYGRRSEPGGSTYATIVLQPNLDQTGKVLMLTGLTMEGSEAVGEFLFSPGFAERLQSLQSTRAAGGKDIRYLEMLVRLSSVGGAARDPMIVATRMQPRQ